MSNETTTLEDLRKQFMDRETEQLRGMQEEMYETMMSNENVYYRNQLPVEIFEQVFLNYFRNINNNQEGDHLLKKWLEISGGYYNEVDLIDSYGNIVLVVPALTPKPDVNIADLSKHYITNMGEDIVNEMRHGKIAAENKMREAFVSMPHVFNNDNHLKDAELKWRAIFVYFNKNNNEGLVSESGNNDGNIQHFSDEIGIEYD